MDFFAQCCTQLFRSCFRFSIELCFLLPTVTFAVAVAVAACVAVAGVDTFRIGCLFQWGLL